MESIEIRKATILDLEKLQEIGKATFYETFASMNSVENMTKYLEEGFSLQKMSGELEDPQASFYFAMLQDQIVGYLKLNTGNSQTELQDDQSIEIERIYVLQNFQGKQVGQTLYEKAIEVARIKKANYLWLGVWEENQKAIRFYEKNGFKAFDKHIFKLGSDEQIDIMMKLKLD